MLLGPIPVIRTFLVPVSAAGLLLGPIPVIRTFLVPVSAAGLLLGPIPVIRTFLVPVSATGLLLGPIPVIRTFFLPVCAAPMPAMPFLFIGILRIPRLFFLCSGMGGPIFHLCKPLDSYRILGGWSAAAALRGFCTWDCFRFFFFCWFRPSYLGFLFSRKDIHSCGCRCFLLASLSGQLRFQRIRCLTPPPLLLPPFADFLSGCHRRRPCIVRFYGCTLKYSILFSFVQHGVHTAGFQGFFHQFRQCAIRFFVRLLQKSVVCFLRDGLRLFFCDFWFCSSLRTFASQYTAIRKKHHSTAQFIDSCRRTDQGNKTLRPILCHHLNHLFQDGIRQIFHSSNDQITAFQFFQNLTYVFLRQTVASDLSQLGNRTTQQFTHPPDISHAFPQPLLLILTGNQNIMIADFPPVYLLLFSMYRNWIYSSFTG